MSVQQLAAEPLARGAGIPAPPKPAQPRWIAGPFFDTFFFVFPTIFSALFLTLMAVYRESATVTWFAIWFITVLGFAHATASFFFYFDRQNLAHYKKSFMKYFVIPVVLFVAVVGIAMLEWWLTQEHIGWPAMGIVPMIGFVYVNFHMTRQNIGFVSFYRHKYGIMDPKERGTDNRLIYLNSLALYTLGWFYMKDDILLPQFRHPWVVYGIGVLFVLLAFAYTNAVIGRMRTLRSTGFRSWPHVGMILTSLIFPLPMLFIFLSLELPVPDYIYPAFGLVAHYVQYIALVCLIHIHKYPGALPSAFSHEDGAPSHGGELVFGRVRYNGVYLLIAFMAVTALAAWGLQYIGGKSEIGLVAAATLGAVFGLGIVHYYVDGLLWAFREEHVRKSVLPYLKPLR